MSRTKEILCYERFVSLFEPSHYPREKIAQWATYAFCRKICFPSIYSTSFQKNMIILYLALIRQEGLIMEEENSKLSKRDKKSMKHILLKELN